MPANGGHSEQPFPPDLPLRSSSCPPHLHGKTVCRSRRECYTRHGADYRSLRCVRQNTGRAEGLGILGANRIRRKRILFDTGNNPEILEQNAKAKGSDLSKLDFVVMSHRHGHHMGGLPYLLKVNPAVKIYAPKESFGVYGADLPSTFYRKDPSLPREQRYYDGTRPRLCDSGLPGPLRTFSLSTRTPRSLPTSISLHWFRANRELSNCANCRWLSIRQRAQFPVL